MDYCIDTEFCERGHHYPIDLWSIGVVSLDGREFYAQSTESVWWPQPEGSWLRENVVPKMLPCPKGSGAVTFDNLVLEKANHYLTDPCEPECPWLSRYEIKQRLLDFIDPATHGKPRFWAWYADYDWVVFCQLFGAMIDLPKGFPMYCLDLKQWAVMLGDPDVPKQAEGAHNALADARHDRDIYEFLRFYAQTHRAQIDRV